MGVAVWRVGVVLGLVAVLALLAGVLIEQRRQSCYAGAMAWQSFLAHRDAGDYQYVADAINGVQTTPRALDRGGATLIVQKVQPDC